MTNKINKAKSTSTVLFILSAISMALFMLIHYGKLSIDLLNFNPKGYFLLVPLFSIFMISSLIFDLKAQKLAGDKSSWTSILFEIIILVLLTAYAIYLYKMPVGYCPIRNFFNNGGFQEVDFK